MGRCILIGKFSLFLGSMALLLVSSCGGSSDNEPVVCTASIEPGIRIQVTDSASGNPISCGASAVVTAGTYSERVDNPSGPDCFDTAMLVAVLERPGTYVVTVSKAGYLDFAVNDVVVTAGVCHVNTVTVEARMSSM
jgi:hypothetical protein